MSYGMGGAPEGRPIIRPIAPAPNYGRRRAVLVAVVLLVGGAAAVFFALGRDDGASEVSGGPASVAEDVNDTLLAANPLASASSDEDLHRGFQPDVLYVALYGKVDTASLGVLGESDVAGAVDRARAVAAEYSGFGVPVVPSFEIIASVASFEAGDDRDYSNESPHPQLQPWIDAADDNGIHVVLDLQSGRQRFQSQIREFEELLLAPHVSVALDPEWRVGPDQVPEGGKIGSVSADEINETVEYLDRLVLANDLPPKMLIVHQFDDRMIRNKADIASTPNVQVVIHMDGFGTLELKRGTYSRVLTDLPDGVLTGWKNFYDEDEPTPSPDETMGVDPQPMFVSFQ